MNTARSTLFGLYLIISNLYRDSFDDRSLRRLALLYALLAIFFYNSNKINEDEREACAKVLNQCLRYRRFFGRASSFILEKSESRYTSSPNVIKIKLYIMRIRVRLAIQSKQEVFGIARVILTGNEDFLDRFIARRH